RQPEVAQHVRMVQVFHPPRREREERSREQPRLERSGDLLDQPRAEYARQHERGERVEVQRELRVAADEVDRAGEEHRADLVIERPQRVVERIVGVDVEERQRMRGDGTGDGGQEPRVQQRIAVVERMRRDARQQRPGMDGREDDEDEEEKAAPARGGQPGGNHLLPLYPICIFAPGHGIVKSTNSVAFTLLPVDVPETLPVYSCLLRGGAKPAMTPPPLPLNDPSARIDPLYVRVVPRSTIVIVIDEPLVFPSILKVPVGPTGNGKLQVCSLIVSAVL